VFPFDLKRLEMTEETHRRWDIIFKWFGLVAVLASAYWTVHSYNQSRASELEQQKYTQKKDEEARTKDQNSFIFQHQATLYFDTARAAATLATAIDPSARDKKAISLKALNDARERFAQLYWGELVIVEDRRVELAMITFQRCLLKQGVNCIRGSVDEFNKPIAPDKLTDAGDPTLQNFSLEIGACVRTALQEGRNIQFGQVKSAITACPYD
jgi:hypothetical protein